MHGFHVSKPFGDNEPYDVVVDAASRMWRVQVKASATVCHNGVSVIPTSHGVPYTPDQIDILAANVIGKDIWYLIPVKALGGRSTITLYPFGSRNGSEEFEEYREA